MEVSNLCAKEEPLKRGSSEGNQSANTQREAMVEQGGVALRQRANTVFL